MTRTEALERARDGVTRTEALERARAALARKRRETQHERRWAAAMQSPMPTRFVAAPPKPSMVDRKAILVLQVDVRQLAELGKALGL